MRRFNNRSILYLHGYDSSSQGQKAQLLRQYCPQNRLLIPDLPLDPQACMHLSEDTLQTASNDTLIIGASLGAFYAYYLASKLKKDCLLINPVISPSTEAKKLLQIEENQEKRNNIANAVNSYLSYENNLKSFKKPKNCFVALGDLDTIIDPNYSAAYFTDAYLQTYHDDHFMFKAFEKALNDFESYLEEKF